MKLAAWKYFSVIMALVLVLGTGVTALGITPATASAVTIQSGHATTNLKDRPSHERDNAASENRTGRHPRDLAGASETGTHRFPILSQGSPMPALGDGIGWYVNGELGVDNGSHGTGPGPSAFKTIRYGLNSAASGDTINIAASYASGTFYDEKLTISKSISLVGEVVDGNMTEVTQSGELIFDITAPGLDVSISNMSINSYNWTGQCIRASGDNLTLDNVDFFGDRRNGGGGGGIYAVDSTLTLIGCYMDGDAGNDNGGAIYADNCTLTLNGCIGWGVAYNGGVIYAVDSTVSATDCYFIEGIANGGGGAIYVNSSNLTALRCSFDGDWEGMDGDGQGVYINAVDDNCTVDISNCTFSQNYLDSGGYGGGIYVISQNEYSATLDLTCCTFYDNETDGDGLGGGLALEGDNCTTTIRNCIFDNGYWEWDQETEEDIWVPSNIVRLDNDGNVSEVGTVNSYYSLYSDTPDITLVTGNIPGEDSLCYGMADNGGLTPTCATDIMSPARGAGSTAFATDQRGVTRGSPSDIGAYQWVGPTYANNSKSTDNGDGLSPATAKKHIYAAVNLAGPGSTTYVAAGTYLGEYHWDVYDLDYYNIAITKPLTLTGAGAASTIIDDRTTHGDNDDDTILDVYDGVADVWDEDSIVNISGFTLTKAQGVDCYGGGLYIESEGVTTVRDCIIEDNYAEDGGGGVYTDWPGEVALTNCTIRNNSTDGDGGGIYGYGAENLTISGCTISGNEAMDGEGGGIYSYYCYIFDLVGSTISGNSASDNGGGLYGESMYGYGDEGPSLISNCTFDSNTTEESGGGIYLYSVDDNDYSVRFEACTLSNNEATGDGGGLFNYYDSNVDLTNCTIYGNSLTGEDYVGGGIYNAGHAELLNCTIASNDAGTVGEGGGWYEEGSMTGVFTNTILANNTADGADNDIVVGEDGSVISNGHNICTTNPEDIDWLPTDNVSTDPGLGGLADNGGPTFTCAIGASSPAFNTAETGPATDQRGITRPQLVIWDVGAYEYDGTGPTGPTVTAITPNSGANTGSVSITNLAGTNFASGATVKLTKSGQTDISGSSVAFVSSSKLTCTFNLTGAVTGTWNVVVTNHPDEQSGTLTNGFTVTSATAPTITAINPVSGIWGQTLSVTITGTNFTGATSVSFGPGITVTYTVAGPTQINATITIAVGAVPGARNVTVTTPHGSATGSFTVNANPSLISGTQSHGGGGGSGGSGGGTGPGNQGISPMSLPNIVVQSATVSTTRVAPGEAVTITANLANKGTVNATSSVKVYVNGKEEAVQGVTVNSGSNRPVSFTLTRNEPGTYTVYVSGTPAGSFTVEQAVDPNIILLVSAALFLSGIALGVVYIRRRQSYY